MHGSLLPWSCFCWPREPLGPLHILIASYLGALPGGTDRSRKPPGAGGAVLCAFPTSSQGDPEKDTVLHWRARRGMFRQTAWVSQGQGHALGVAASSPRSGFIHSTATERTSLHLRCCLPDSYIHPRPPRRRAGGGCAPGVSSPGGLHPPLTIFLNTQLHPLRTLRTQTPPWDLADSLKTRPELKWASRLVSAGLFQGRKFSENVLLGREVQPLPAFLCLTPPPLLGPSSFTADPPAAQENPRWESGRSFWVPPHKCYQSQTEVQCGERAQRQTSEWGWSRCRPSGQRCSALQRVCEPGRGGHPHLDPRFCCTRSAKQLPGWLSPCCHSQEDAVPQGALHSPRNVEEFWRP